LEFGGIVSEGREDVMTGSEIWDHLHSPHCQPFIIRWGWDSGGGHHIVGYGYDLGGPWLPQLVYYMNPLPVGEGSMNVADYDWVVSGDGHTWTRSLMMTTTGPTAVDLTAFDAVAHDGVIDIRWITANEIGNAGFRLYRGLSRESEKHQISQGLIAAQGDEIKGASYEFADNTVSVGQTYYYWLEALDLKGGAAMHGPVWAAVTSATGKPAVVTLAQNQPNPFVAATEIRYGLPRPLHVDLAIFDVRGREIVTLVDRFQAAGYKAVRWDATDEKGLSVPAGVYFYRLKAGERSYINKMVMLPQQSN
jgi:hypothetical protein